MNERTASFTSSEWERKAMRKRGSRECDMCCVLCCSRYCCEYGMNERTASFGEKGNEKERV